MMQSMTGQGTPNPRDAQPGRGTPRSAAERRRAQQRLEQWAAHQPPLGSPGPAETATGPGWWPDPSGSGLLRWWDGTQWTTVTAHPIGRSSPVGYLPPNGLPSRGGDGPPGGYALRSGTSGLAIASFVLSLLWFGGLGSLLAVIFGVRSRRAIRDSGGALSGAGLAVAGLVLGATGLVGGIIVWVSVAEIGSNAANVVHRALTPRTLALGQTAAVSDTTPGGIDLVTVFSVTYPVTSQDPLDPTPEAAKQFAAADVEMCAGPGGSQNGPNPLEFSLVFASGDRVPATLGDIREPAVADVHALRPGQCVRGFVPFEIVQGTHPSTIEYGLINAFQWTLPPSG